MPLAGYLLAALWQVQPPLVSEFVSQRHLAPLLKLTARRAASLQDRLICTALVHQVWTYTASLVSEPLLVQAIPAIVWSCATHLHGDSDSSDELKQTSMNLQVCTPLLPACDPAWLLLHTGVTLMLLVLTP